MRLPIFNAVCVWGQVGLYAEYDRSKLLGFLRKSQNYSLENAHAICKAKEFWEEVVFVLSRMGNNKTALNLIMEKMTNVRQVGVGQGRAPSSLIPWQAVDFCVDHNDDELWEDLIQHCLQNQELVAPLLNDIGPHIQPLKIVRQIPHGRKTPKSCWMSDFIFAKGWSFLVCETS